MENPESPEPEDVHRIGGMIAPPQLISRPEHPGADLGVNGCVRLLAVIGSNGIPREMRITKSLGDRVDQIAIEYVRQWRFQPAYKRSAADRERGADHYGTSNIGDGEERGEAVAVGATFEINFGGTPEPIANPTLSVG